MTELPALYISNPFIVCKYYFIVTVHLFHHFILLFIIAFLFYFLFEIKTFTIN
jgi:hypothetical protein